MEETGDEMRSIILNVPESRQNRDKWPAAALMSATLVLVVACSSTWYKENIMFHLDMMSDKNTMDEHIFLSLVMLATAVVSQLFAEFLRRMCLFWEELYHLETRYRQSKTTALCTSLSMNKNYVVISTLFSITCICLYTIYSSQYSSCCWIVILTYTALYLLSHVFGLMAPRESELLNLDEAQMNFGQTFAWQYYFGYLKIVLPDFLERIKEYELKEGVTVTVHKLFILLPESCYLPPILSDHQADHGLLEYVGDLREVCRDRSGTKGRKYKNPVYRIQVENVNLDPIYCCMEGAALLNSLHEMCEEEKLTGITEEKKSQHKMQFYSVMKEILSQEKLGDLVELVSYEDMDKNDRQVKICDVIKHRISTISAHFPPP